MSRINTNVASLIAVNNLNNNNQSLQTSLQRLSTGYRINSGKDDPAGLIASENLQAEQRATEAAISNAQRANSIIGTADGALAEVSNLLVSLQGLVNNSANTAGLSPQEQDANQLQVDSILSTINRISNSTAFGGVKLLNGTFDYTTSSISTSDFTNVSVNAAQLAAGTTTTVSVGVTTSAQVGQLVYAGPATLTTSSTISVTGNKGSAQITFNEGATTADIIAAVNTYTDTTGVKALTSGGTTYFQSTAYGATQFVSVKASSAEFTTNDRNDNNAATTGAGQDIVLSVNGTKVTGTGLSAHAVVAGADIDLALNSAADATGNTLTFGITGGGATFSIGSQVSAASNASIGIRTVDTVHLGAQLNGNALVTLADLGSGKAAALNTGNVNLAQQIVSQAIDDVSGLRGRLGAFQANVLGLTINSLNVADENIQSSNSAIQDTDFASETANLTRSQILVQAATSVLSTANSSPQAILKLLG